MYHHTKIALEKLFSAMKPILPSSTAGIFKVTNNTEIKKVGQERIAINS